MSLRDVPIFPTKHGRQMVGVWVVPHQPVIRWIRLLNVGSCNKLVVLKSF